MKKPTIILITISILFASGYVSESCAGNTVSTLAPDVNITDSALKTVFSSGRSQPPAAKQEAVTKYYDRKEIQLKFKEWISGIKTRFSEKYIKEVTRKLEQDNLKTVMYTIEKNNRTLAVFIARKNREYGILRWTLDFLEVRPGFSGKHLGPVLLKEFVGDYRMEEQRGNFQYQGKGGNSILKFLWWNKLSIELGFYRVSELNVFAFRDPSPFLYKPEILIDQSI